MAMPPDGSSSWAHHEDIWYLDSGGARFASVIVALDGSRASINMPLLDSAHDSFCVLRFVRAGAGVELIGGDAARGTMWRPGGAIELEDARTIYPRRSLGAIEGGEPIGRLRLSPAEAIELLDAVGRVRISVVRGAGAAPERATRVMACGGAIAIDLIAHPDTAIRRIASSLP
jgi:hypothetical protein